MRLQERPYPCRDFVMEGEADKVSLGSKDARKGISGAPRTTSPLQDPNRRRLSRNNRRRLSLYIIAATT